jgi:hypothetical protein
MKRYQITKRDDRWKYRLALLNTALNTAAKNGSTTTKNGSIYNKRRGLYFGHQKDRGPYSKGMGTKIGFSSIGISYYDR